jgi:hypothetical protein
MSDLTNIFKMLFGNLTRSGVDYGNTAPPSDQPRMVSGGQPGGSNQRFFKDPSEAGVALAQAMRPMAQPQTSDISGTISVPGGVHATGENYVTPPAGGIGPPQDPNTQYGYDPSADPSPTFHSPGSGGLLPHIFRPSFRQAAIDEAGNVRSSAPGLSKGGTLLKILFGGLQGVGDAIAGGALNAPRNGESPFGIGFQAAQQMPWLRAWRFSAQQHQDLEDQALQSKVQNAPADRAAAQAQQKATLDETVASTGLKKAQTDKANQDPKPTVENLDQLIAGAAQKAIQEGRSPTDDPTVTQLSDVKTGLLKQAATSRDDKAIEIMGKPSAEWTPEEKRYMKGYDAYVKKTKVEPGAIRAQIFAQGRAVQVEDPATGVKSYEPAGEAMRKGSIAGSTNLQKNAYQPQARIKDVERVSTGIEGNVNALDQDNAQKALIAHSLTDPSMTTAGQFIKSKIASQLSPKSRDYVTNVLSMREQIMGLNQLLTGTSGTSDARIKAIWDTLPNGSEPDSDMARRKMKLVRGMIGNVREAFPMMKVIPGQGGTAAPTGQSGQAGEHPFFSHFGGTAKPQ